MVFLSVRFGPIPCLNKPTRGSMGQWVGKLTAFPLLAIKEKIDYIDYILSTHSYLACRPKQALASFELPMKPRNTQWQTEGTDYLLCRWCKKFKVPACVLVLNAPHLTGDHCIIRSSHWQACRTMQIIPNHIEPQRCFKILAVDKVWPSFTFKVFST